MCKLHIIQSRRAFRRAGFDGNSNSNTSSGGMRGAVEFAVPDEVGVLGVILAMANVQTLCQTLSGRGTLPKPLPPDPAHSVDGSGGMQNGVFRRLGVTGASPCHWLGSGILAPFFGFRRLL